MGHHTYVRRIGIITMPTGQLHTKKDLAVITENNVRWFAERGIDIVPIPFRTKHPEMYMNKIHGLYLQGGPEYDKRYITLIKRLLELAIRRNQRGEHFPVWGTCHGFQTLLMLFGHLQEDGSDLEQFQSLDGYMTNLYINITEKKTSNMLKSFSPQFLDYITKERHILFSHEHGMSPREFYKNTSLRSSFHVLATARDRENKPYVALIEGRKFPFFGSQFHPEAVPSLEPFRDFFVEEVMKNDRRKPLASRGKTFRQLHTHSKCSTRKNRDYYRAFVNKDCYFFE